MRLVDAEGTGRDECDHGSLRRACLVCELTAEVARLTADLARERERAERAENDVNHEWIYCPMCGSCGVGGCCGYHCDLCKDRHDGETQDDSPPRDLGDLRLMQGGWKELVAHAEVERDQAVEGELERAAERDRALDHVRALEKRALEAEAQAQDLVNVRQELERDLRAAVARVRQAPDERDAAFARVRALEAERDRAQKRAKAWGAAARHWRGMMHAVRGLILSEAWKKGGGAICSFCGHLSATREDMAEHMGVCDRHPAAVLRAERDRLREALREVWRGAGLHIPGADRNGRLLARIDRIVSRALAQSESAAGPGSGEGGR